jgi:DNA-binding protein HU-beta
LKSGSHKQIRAHGVSSGGQAGDNRTMAAKKSTRKTSGRKKPTGARKSATKKSTAKKSTAKRSSAKTPSAKKSPTKKVTAGLENVAQGAKKAPTRAQKLGAIMEAAGVAIQKGAEIVETIKRRRRA